MCARVHIYVCTYMDTINCLSFRLICAIIYVHTYVCNNI